jgi:hypothetical protein
MQRTQISLTVEERQILEEAAARTGKSISALIRDAVEVVYGTQRSSSDDLDLMRKSFGTWKEHEDDGANVVERLRSGSRIEPVVQGRGADVKAMLKHNPPTPT